MQHAPCRRMKMKVYVQRSRVLAAGAQGPTEVPLTVFDRFAPNLHVPIMFPYHPPLPENDDIVVALSAALTHFPTLAGRLGYSRELGRPCIQVGCQDGGMLLVEATVPTPLSDHLPLQPSKRLDVLRPPPGAERDHVFILQVTRFACGGAVVVSLHHHHVADGRSMSTFFSVWARALWGETLDHLPIYDRSWLRPRSPPRCEFDHWGTDFVAPTTGISLNGSGRAMDAGDGITNVVLHYTEDYITKLKDEVGNKYSSFETLLGHMWRKMAVARGLHGDDCTMLRVSVNGRGRMNPPAPDEFFGNLVLNAYPKTDVRRLLAGGLAGAAATIHDAVQRVDERYLQSFVDFGELHGDKELVPVYDVDGVVPVYNTKGSAATPGAAAETPTVVLEVDNWLSFRIEEMGGPLLCGFLLPWLPFEGSVVFMPAISDAGGVHVFVTLLEKHATVLRQISHSMDDAHFLRSSL